VGGEAIGLLRPFADERLRVPAVSLEAGLSARLELEIADGDTALAAHTGDVPVLATPRVIALVEEAAVAAVDGQLEAGETTVSMRVQVDHVSPAPVGDVVSATAKLEKVEGRRLIFSVSVTDIRGLVAAGKVTRVVVDRGRFLDKCH
jgi:predicted thioesterase